MHDAATASPIAPIAAINADASTAVPIDHAAWFREAPRAQCLVDRHHRVVDATDGYLRLARSDRERVVGRRLVDAFAEDAKPSGLVDAVDRAFSTGEPVGSALVRVSIPVSLVEGDGFVDAVWNVSYQPLRDAAGDVALVALLVDDVASLRDVVRRADDGMPLAAPRGTPESDRLRLLRLFDQSLSFTIFMREPDHIVELANPAYLRMVGEEDLRNRPFAKAHRGEPPVPLAMLDAVYESGVPIIEHGLPLRVPNDDGRMHTIYVDVVIQQIVDSSGKVIGTFMQGNDVTMAKATQDELSAYRSRLEEMVAERTRALERSEAERRTAEAALHRAQRLEAVGKLTGGVAHDFNNVLQIIRGNLQLMQRMAPADGPFGGRIEAALDGVERGAKLASQLLAFGRRQPLEPVVVDLDRVLHRMGDLLRRALGESIEIRTEGQPDLWHVLVDVPRLENVILNIAINARDAMDDRGTLTMTLRNVTEVDGAADRLGLTPGDYVVLSIADSGSGMSAEVQRRAFEPFFTTKPEGEGTGLGLSMVYGFMKQSGGHVTLDSEEGRGTTIALFLPRTDEPVTETVTAPVAAPVRGNGETILVVEDDEAVRIATVETLQDLGYRVLRAADGHSALTIIRSGVPIDLVFTDVIMPGPVPSTEMVRQAQAALPDLRVLFTSGFTRDAIVDRDRLRAGVNLLSKPYGREELAGRLRQLLDDPGPDGGAQPDAPAPQPKDAANVNSSVESGDSANRAAGQRRVLLVEDNEDVRETTIEFINEVGYDVVAVESAEAALDALAAARYDIVFTDVSLPGMSGIDLIKHVRGTDPSQRIVIASGFGADLGKFGAEAGVAVLSKPYDLTALERTLDRVLAEGNAARPGHPG